MKGKAGIISVCNNKQNTAYGFIWKYHIAA